MGDEGFDPCECIYTHEFAVRRLLSLLRQSQSYCTDTECFTEAPRPGPQDAGSDNMFFFAMVWTILAMALFFLRPSALRSNSDSKPTNSRQDGGSPPSPPTAN
ncbi:Small integral membrane protein 14 [Halocaridina rubra]|uniref:Small integral membrane protein 14 n=1 Tax=Halocaridina rubra TaxID=373956 RepID=A0AAN8WR51_HALRR